MSCVLPASDSLCTGHALILAVILSLSVSLSYLLSFRGFTSIPKYLNGNLRKLKPVTRAQNSIDFSRLASRLLYASIMIILLCPGISL